METQEMEFADQFPQHLFPVVNRRAAMSWVTTRIEKELAVRQLTGSMIRFHLVLLGYSPRPVDHLPYQRDV